MSQQDDMKNIENDLEGFLKSNRKSVPDSPELAERIITASSFINHNQNKSDKAKNPNRFFSHTKLKNIGGIAAILMLSISSAAIWQNFADTLPLKNNSNEAIIEYIGWLDSEYDGSSSYYNYDLDI